MYVDEQGRQRHVKKVDEKLVAAIESGAIKLLRADAAKSKIIEAEDKTILRRQDLEKRERRSRRNWSGEAREEKQERRIKRGEAGEEEKEKEKEEKEKRILT